jgi:hypothetical protein
LPATRWRQSKWTRILSRTFRLTRSDVEARNAGLHSAPHAKPGGNAPHHRPGQGHAAVEETVMDHKPSALLFA